MPAAARCSRSLAHFFHTFRHVLVDFGQFMFLLSRARVTLVAENLFLRKQLAIFQERKVRPRRADDSTRWMMAILSRVFQWRDALLNVRPDTLIRWHRKEVRLFWRQAIVVSDFLVVVTARFGILYLPVIKELANAKDSSPPRHRASDSRLDPPAIP